MTSNFADCIRQLGIDFLLLLLLLLLFYNLEDCIKELGSGDLLLLLRRDSCRRTAASSNRWLRTRHAE
jgi:hypothetical protein